MMTYNIQYCYDEVSTIIPDRTAARIIAENPDFCCVNEVRDSAARSARCSANGLKRSAPS